MATPVGGVNDGGNPYAGGTLSRAGRPTGASGDFTSVGSGGFPAPSAGQIAIARNNQGTNVRIPYSRVVPMHGKDKLRVRDSRLAGTGYSDVYEYDGLEAGELAWVMGKQFAINPRSGVNFPSLVATAVQHASLLSNVSGPPGVETDASRRQALEAIVESWRSVPGGGFMQGPGGGAIAFADPLTAAQRGGAYTGYVDAAGNPTPAPAPGAGQVTGPDGAALVPQDAFGGYGPDRMQRMAYTNWMEAFFEQRIATQTIDLHTLRVLDPARTHSFLDSDIALYGSLQPWVRRQEGAAGGAAAPNAAGVAPHLTAATALCVPDLAYALQSTPSMQRPYGTTVAGQNGNTNLSGPNEMQVQKAMMQGLFVMEKGPFLRTYGAEDSTVNIRLPDRPGSGRTWARPTDVRRNQAEMDETPKLADVPRHLGSSLAQKALFCELKKHGVFNWVPDGICLSKYATGPDGYADAEFDARSGQLFNVGVQGPCITKTWTVPPSTIHPASSMHAMPGDKVFILVVGTVNYELAPKKDGDALAVAARGVVAANAERTASLATEGFTPNRNAVAVAGVGDVVRPNGGNYVVRPDEAVRSEDARREMLAASPALEAAMTNLEDAAAADRGSYHGRAFGELVNAMNDLRTVADPTVADLPMYEAQRARAEAALATVQASSGDVARGFVATAEFDETAQEVRNGTRAVAKAQISDIRLMRASSSFLTNTSHFDHRDRRSRCGLRIGHLPVGAPGGAGVRNPARDTVIAKEGPAADPGNGVDGDYYQNQGEVNADCPRIRTRASACAEEATPSGSCRCATCTSHPRLQTPQPARSSAPTPSASASTSWAAGASEP